MGSVREKYHYIFFFVYHRKISSLDMVGKKIEYLINVLKKTYTVKTADYRKKLFINN